VSETTTPSLLLSWTDLTDAAGSDLPTFFEARPRASFQRARCDLLGIELDEEVVAISDAPQGPNTVAANRVATGFP
jgi:hypothetical protein